MGIQVVLREVPLMVTLFVLRNIIINDINLSMKMVSFQMRLDVKKALSFRMVDIKNVLNEDVLEIAKKCSLAHMQVVQNQNVCDLV